jgi:hypothetical protein
VKWDQLATETATWPLSARVEAAAAILRQTGLTCFVSIHCTDAELREICPPMMTPEDSGHGFDVARLIRGAVTVTVSGPERETVSEKEDAA